MLEGFGSRGLFLSSSKAAQLGTSGVGVIPDVLYTSPYSPRLDMSESQRLSKPLVQSSLGGHRCIYKAQQRGFH